MWTTLAYFMVLAFMCEKVMTPVSHLVVCILLLKTVQKDQFKAMISENQLE